MWNATSVRLSHRSGRRFVPCRAGEPLSHMEVIAGWQNDPAFRAWFIRLLAESPFAAYFWETPPLTLAAGKQAFEFVLIDSPELAATRADPSPFAEHFAAAGPDQTVVSFPSLGGDAYLIAPCPLAADQAYLHLGAFAREGPAEQQQALWQAVGQAVSERLGVRPIWVSTAGLGVFWLHLRLDSSPKYYRHRAYAEGTWATT